jgi:hypothetical protein
MAALSRMPQGDIDKLAFSSNDAQEMYSVASS